MKPWGVCVHRLFECKLRWIPTSSLTKVYVFRLLEHCTCFIFKHSLFYNVYNYLPEKASNYNPLFFLLNKWQNSALVSVGYRRWEGKGRGRWWTWKGKMAFLLKERPDYCYLKPKDISNIVINFFDEELIPKRKMNIPNRIYINAGFSENVFEIIL